MTACAVKDVHIFNIILGDATDEVAFARNAASHTHVVRTSRMRKDLMYATQM